MPLVRGSLLQLKRLNRGSGVTSGLTLEEAEALADVFDAVRQTAELLLRGVLRHAMQYVVATPLMHRTVSGFVASAPNGIDALVPACWHRTKFLHQALLGVSAVASAVRQADVTRQVSCRFR